MRHQINNEDEIDLKELTKVFWRNKKIVGTSSIIFFFIGIFISVFSEKKWEGNFQIVLNPSNKMGGIMNNNSTLNSLVPFTIKGASMDINTEVGILESPAVLMPIFNYVSTQKKLLDEKYNLNFKDWKTNNLNVKLKDKTYILDINYRDKNKKIVLPVLKRISNAYQEYSDKKQKKSYSYTNDYLKKQVSFYKEKSKSSLKKVQEFAIDQNLLLITDPKFNDQSKDSRNEFDIFSNADLELTRIKANNKIKQIDLQIKDIESLDIEENTSLLSFIGNIDNDLSVSSLYENIEKIDSEIIKYSSRYTYKDPIIKRLKEEKKIAIKLLKDKAIGMLKAKKIVAESIKESATRPKDVLLKYKELIRESFRDEKTLIQLEDRLRSINLAIAKKDEPWELITTPTLLDKPIGLRKRTSGLVGIIFGFILGFIYSYIREKVSDTLFETDDIKKLLKLNIVKKLDLDIKSLNNNLSTFILDKHTCNNGPINILLNENINDKKLNEIKNLFKLLEQKYKIKINISFLDSKFEIIDDLIFITSLSKLKIATLEAINERLITLNIKISAVFCCD